MAKRMTDIQRLINFAMSADEESLNSAIQSLTAIRDNRYPKTTKQTRKPRADAGKPRTRGQTPTPTALSAAGESSSVKSEAA